MADTPKIFPLGESALTIDFGNAISVDLNDKAIAAAGWFQNERFPGFIEAVPAYSSVVVYFDLIEVRRHFSQYRTAFEAVLTIAQRSLNSLRHKTESDKRIVDIPVDFGNSSALDLDVISDQSGLPKHEVLDIFTATTYRVFMLGFLPGFAYMGEVDERIAIPRRDTPRLRVPKGSVGIAGRQTGVYPLESPGGWQIIGRTNAELFTPDKD